MGPDHGGHYGELGPCSTHSGPHLGEGLGGGETFTLEVTSGESPPLQGADNLLGLVRAGKG